MAGSPALKKGLSQRHLTMIAIGGVIGAQIGASFASRLRAEQLRILLALLVIGVGFRLLLELVLRPDELYSITPRL